MTPFHRQTHSRHSLPLVASLVLALPAVPGWCAGRAPARRPAAARPAPARSGPRVRALQVSPAAVTLEGEGAAQTLLVTGILSTGAAQDLTASGTYRTGDPRVARVDRDGTVRIQGDGSTVIEVRAGGASVRVPVRARGARQQAPVSFTRDIVPVLSKAGCNQGACHAKQGGKNGFQLSVFAFDPEADYRAIARQGHGRRINRLEPGESLLLRKATLAVPHAGGQRFKSDSPEYRLLARWIAEGAEAGIPGEPALTSVEIEPRERTLGLNQQQRLQVTAVYSDGSRRDVTGLAQFKSNESSVAEIVEPAAVKTSAYAGEAAVMARYMGQVAVCRITVPLNAGVAASAYAGLPRQNYIDDLVYRKLAQLNLLPSEPCDDATFLRRASLDLTGTLPTAEETRRFLAECEQERHARGGMGGWVDGCVGVEKPVPAAGSLKSPTAKAPSGPVKQDLFPPQATPTHPSTHTPTPSGKNIPALKARAALVEELLNRPEYADYWAMRWSNLLLVNPDLLLPRGAYAFDRWLRDAFRDNMPFDRFAREIVTASGETYRDGPPNFFRALPIPGDAGKSVSQLFLGVRIDCAQCHHHPFERWGQDDYYSMAAFFARVKTKSTYPEGYHSVIYPGPDGEVKHPKTDQVMPPKPLGGPPVTAGEDEDRREYLARWMTAPENPFFARAIVNRVWGLMMGRGIVEPVDDFRVTNPATNEPLLDAMAKDFVARGYDLKHLLRTIAASAVYQRSSEATPNNARDTRNYSRFYTRRLPAEVLLDAVGQVTGVPQTFRGHPVGERAIQMWDSRLDVEFLEIFGRPGRQSVCECERSSDGSVTQMLHLMNGAGIQDRLAKEKGFVTALEKSGKSEDEIVTELYLTLFSREPRPAELEAARAAFKREKVTRRAAIEDLFWALLNSAEFLLNH